MSASVLSENTPALTLQSSLLGDSVFGSTILGVEGWNGVSDVAADGFVDDMISPFWFKFVFVAEDVVVFEVGLVVSTMDISGFIIALVEVFLLSILLFCGFTNVFVSAGPTIKYPIEKNTAVPTISSAMPATLPERTNSLAETLGFIVFSNCAEKP